MVNGVYRDLKDLYGPFRENLKYREPYYEVTYQIKGCVILEGESGKKDDKKKMMLESIIEGKKMELYTERRTGEMHACVFCEKICYKKTPAKELGKKWICIDCLRQLKELLDSLKQWEEEITLEEEMKKQLGDGLGLQEL